MYLDALATIGRCTLLFDPIFLEKASMTRFAQGANFDMTKISKNAKKIREYRPVNNSEFFRQIKSRARKRGNETNVN